MLFTSPVFLFLFLPLLITLYYLSPHRIRNTMLLWSSLLFYAWGEVFYVAIMLVSITINYSFGIFLDADRPPHQRQRILWGAVGLNLLLLGTFKYANFLFANINNVLEGLSLSPIKIGDIHLPLGISFFTFQAISYIVDIYRQKVATQRNIFSVALYISLFPQLIAGPIVRYHDIVAQIRARTGGLDLFVSGIRRFVYGLSKKLIIANTMGAVVDDIMGLPVAALHPGLAWLGLICYALQIYFDFSGYSDMAIGLGRMFGFTFLENFNYPYIASSVQEFWRRWHISLSSWFRDYLYIPLGGNRSHPVRVYVNLVTVFFLCGLWHGASWSFVVWGLFHGLFLAIERSGFARVLSRLPRAFGHLYTLLVVLIAWVFFRVDELGDALAYIGVLFGVTDGHGGWRSKAYWNPEFVFVLVLGAILSTPVYRWLTQIFDRISSERPMFYLLVNISVISALIFLSSIFIAGSTYSPFIYFRF